MDDQTKVTNHTFTPLSQSIASKTLKDLDLKLVHAKFAYNQSPSYSTGWSPFEVVCVINPLTPTDLILIPSNSQINYEAKEIAKMMKVLRAY